MNWFYFPQTVYIEAHKAFMEKTGAKPSEMEAYSLKDPAWFIEVVFAHLDGTDFPEMKG